MKTLSKTFASALLLSLVSVSAVAGPGSGNGTGLAQLEGFENYAAQSTQLRSAITQAMALVKTLGLTNPQYFPELSHLSDEIQFSRYLLIPNDVTVQANRAPGDYPIGTFLVASTDTAQGAPTKIYPTLITQLTQTQLVQMVIHEALHRALPEPMNGYEPIVVKLTDIITQYAPQSAPAAVRSYLDLVKTKKVPWMVQISHFEGTGVDEDTEQFKEGALRSIFDQNIIAETENSSRIKIFLSAYYNKTTATIEIKDAYRNIIYTKNLDGLSVDKRNAAANQFVRQAIQKIQDDLSWQ